MIAVRSRLGARLAVIGAIGLTGCGRPPAGDVHSEAPDAPAPIDARMIDARMIDAPDASPFDAPRGLPDLQLVAERMTHTAIVTSDFFDERDCAVEEQCVGAPGVRTLLRFDTVTSNLGVGDLQLGPVPPEGESNATYQWSKCHKHHHVPGYVSYELIDAAGATLKARKQAFCLEDSVQVLVGAPSHGYSCMNQGISRGWADSYTRGLPCQWIDITDLAPGAYTLRVVVNPEHAIEESDTTNNELRFGVAF